MADAFPRTDVGGVSLSRMLIGTNWILGYSHRTPAADCHIKSRNGTAGPVADILATFLEAGVDTIMGLFEPNPHLTAAVRRAEDRTGKGMIVIDTPVIDVTDTPEGRRNAESTIARSRQNGATFCLPHHTSVEQLVRKDSRTIERLPDYLNTIRNHDMIPGLSAHMPELIVYSDLNEYDVQTYIQIYNCMGFLMQVEIEYIHKVIWDAKKPVMTIKPMAAGRVTPFVGLTFAWHTLRPRDMVTVGCFTPEEAAEDIEISRAALENRPPELSGRDSPQKTGIMRE